MLRQVVLHVSLVVVLLAAGCGGGGSGSGSGSTAPPEGTGSITGTARLPGAEDNSGILVVAQKLEDDDMVTTVKALQTGKLTPAQVSAAQADPAQVPAPGGSAWSTTTDRSGRFELRGLPPGKYAVTASKTGALAAVTTAEVKPAAATQLDIVLTPTGSIQGVARVQGDTDHSGIIVYIPATSYMGITDAAGNYTISNVPAGTYQLRAFRMYGPVAVGPTVTVKAGQVAKPGTITVQSPPKNHNPVITSIQASKTIIQQEEEVEVSCTASDEDGDQLTISWTVDPEAGAWTIPPSNNPARWKASCGAGTYTFTATAYDSRGGRAQRQINVQVQARRTEVEPNNDLEHATPIELGQRYYGENAVTDSHDYYRFVLPRETILYVDVSVKGGDFGYNLSYFGPEVKDASGRTVASWDVRAPNWTWTDFHLQTTARLTPGTYYLLVPDQYLETDYYFTVRTE